MRIDCKTTLNVDDKSVVTHLESIENITVGRLLSFIQTKKLNCLLYTVEKKAEELLPEVREAEKKMFPFQKPNYIPESVPAVVPEGLPPRVIRDRGRKLNKELKLSNTKLSILRAPHLTPKGLKQWAKTYGISYSAAKRLRHAHHTDIAWIK